MKLYKLLPVKIALVLLASLLVFGCAKLPKVEDTTLTIVHTNDTHGGVLKIDKSGFGDKSIGGTASLATMVREYRKKALSSIAVLNMKNFRIWWQ